MSIKSVPVIGVIPAYKPDEKLVSVVQGCLQHVGLLRIVIVDDGSGDAFSSLFDRLSSLEGVNVLHMAVNSGTGAAIKLGLQYSLWHFPEAVGFVTFDADGQHLPKDVKKVVERFLERPNEFALGVRDFHNASAHIPFRSRFGNLCTEWCFRVFTGIQLADTQTGLRCYSRALAEKCTQILRNRYEYQLESLLVAADETTYLQIPIETVYEDNNKRSHFNPIRDSIRIYMVFFRFVFVTAFCSVLDYAVFSVLFLLSGALFASMICARIVSVSVTFLLNKHKVFRSKGRGGVQCAKFIALASILFAASYFGVRWLAGRWGVNPLASKIVIETVLFFLSFLVQRLFVFARCASVLKEK